MQRHLSQTTEQEGSRLVTLDLLDQGREAAARMDDPSDPEALHDLRVAVRRMRSILRAYGPVMRDTVSRKWNNRLRRLGRRTGSARDSEVQLEWFEKELAKAGRQPNPVVAEFEARLRHKMQVAYGQIRKDALPIFYKHERALRLELETYYREMRLNGRPPRRSTFGELASDVIRNQANALWTALGNIRRLEDTEEIHRARIMGKRLRYLLEPLRAEESAAKGLVAWLKKLQDVLGDLNDAQLMEGEISGHLDGGGKKSRAPAVPPDEEATPTATPEGKPVMGLAELLHAAQRDRVSLYDHFQNIWNGGSADAFLADVYQLVARLAIQSRQRRPSMRFFLLNGFPTSVRRFSASDHSQGWLEGDRIRECLSLTRTTAGRTHRRSVEVLDGETPIVVDEEIRAELFQKLWRLTRGKRLRQRTYAVTGDGQPTWYVHRFMGQSLVLASILVPPGDDDLPGPKWLRKRIVREVTDDPSFASYSLAG